MLTMILGGLWHGAAWTFVLWGYLPGVLLVGHRLARAPGSSASTRRPDRPRLLEGPADRRHVPHGLPRLADLPREFGRAGRRDAPGDRSPAGDPRGGLPRPGHGPIIPLLMVQFAQYLAKDLDVILRTPWYVR